MDPFWKTEIVRKSCDKGGFRFDASRRRRSDVCSRPVVVLCLVAAALALAGPRAFCSDSNCGLTATSYAVTRSNFEYEDVSISYGHGIYSDVRWIIQYYLADDLHDKFDCFYEPGTTGILMELNCRVKRIADEVHLSVNMKQVDMRRSLLSCETIAPFFRPERVVAEFAAAFPESFRGKVARAYTHPAVQQGFHWDRRMGLWLGNVYYSDISFTNLIQDLSMSEDLPPGLLEDFERFERFDRIERGTFLILALWTLAAANFGGIVLAADTERHLRAYSAIVLPAAVATAAGWLDLELFRPRRLLKTLAPIYRDL